jgi:hypothetical protein
MNSRFSRLARLASTTNHPIGTEEELATNGHDLGALLDCFSEIDTESKLPERNKIAYLEQLLRLREPRHLTESQARGRRFLLDMLSLLCLLPEGQTEEALPQGWDPTLEFKYLVYLLERTAKPVLATQVRQATDITALGETGILALREWLHHNGLDAHELALIQPNFFRTQKRVETQQNDLRIHPLFAALSKASQERNHDYLTGTFFGMSQPLVMENAPVKNTAKSQESLEAAMATIFDTPYDQKTAVQTRVKAFFIPNRFGEPVVALSFMNE